MVEIMGEGPSETVGIGGAIAVVHSDWIDVIKVYPDAKIHRGPYRDRSFATDCAELTIRVAQWLLWQIDPNPGLP